MKHRHTSKPTHCQYYTFNGATIASFSQILTPKCKYKSFAQYKGNYILFSSPPPHTFYQYPSLFSFMPTEHAMCSYSIITLKNDRRVIYHTLAIFFLETMPKPHGSSWHVRPSGYLQSCKLGLILYILDLQSVKNQCN